MKRINVHLWTKTRFLSKSGMIQVALDRCTSLRASEVDTYGGQLSEVRSITEIYRSAEMATAEGDALSQSTLEGGFSFDRFFNCFLDVHF